MSKQRLWNWIKFWQEELAGADIEDTVLLAYITARLELVRFHYKRAAQDCDSTEHQKSP